MTDPGPTSTPSGKTGASGGGSAWTILAPALALVLGLVLGGVLVGVATSDDEPEASEEEAPSASPTPGDDDTSGASAGDTVIVVPEECLEAAETVEEATTLAQRGAEALRDFESSELRSVLKRLEELDQRARSQAQACQEVDASTASP